MIGCEVKMNLSIFEWVTNIYLNIKNKIAKKQISTYFQIQCFFNRFGIKILTK